MHRAFTDASGTMVAGTAHAPVANLQTISLPRFLTLSCTPSKLVYVSAEHAQLLRSIFHL
jgi:hypothetical protein